MAAQLIAALPALPFSSREDEHISPGDPHAGNLLYGESNRELVIFSRRRRHTRLQGDWSSDVCSSDLDGIDGAPYPFRDVLLLGLRCHGDPLQKIGVEAHRHDAGFGVSLRHFRTADS